MKNQALFSSKDKSKKLKCRLLQFLFGTLRVKTTSNAPRTSTLKCLSIGTPKTINFLFARNGKINVFYVSQYLSTLYLGLNVPKFWDT